MGGLTFNVTNSAGAVVWEEVSTRLIELSKISDNTSGLLQVNQPLSLQELTQAVWMCRISASSLSSFGKYHFTSLEHEGDLEEKQTVLSYLSMPFLSTHI